MNGHTSWQKIKKRRAKKLWSKMSADFAKLYAAPIENGINNVTGSIRREEIQFRMGFVDGWYVSLNLEPPSYDIIGHALILDEEA